MTKKTHLNAGVTVNGMDANEFSVTSNMDIGKSFVTVNDCLDWLLEMRDMGYGKSVINLADGSRREMTGAIIDRNGILIDKDGVLFDGIEKEETQ